MRVKTFIAAAAFAAVTLSSGINAFNNASEVKLSDLALANIEALANDGEDGEESGITCGRKGGKCWNEYQDGTMIICNGQYYSACERTPHSYNFCEHPCLYD